MIDTASKRRSAGGVAFLPLGPGVTPDSNKSQAWRYQAGWSYSGFVRSNSYYVDMFQGYVGGAMVISTQTLNIATFEGVGVYVMARIKGNNGVNITRAVISSIVLKVFDRDDDALVLTTNLVVNNVVFDTLQTRAIDPRWTKDTKGYNFGAIVPGAVLTTLDQYRAEFIFTPTTGELLAIVAIIDVKELLSY